MKRVRLWGSRAESLTECVQYAYMVADGYLIEYPMPMHSVYSCE